MPVTDVQHSFEDLSITITADFAAPVQRVWQIYVDPRQLEQIWGPPSHPATFVEHALVPGHRSTYYMTGPEGEKYRSWWLITTVDEPHSFSFEDGFATEDFSVDESLPVSRSTFTFTPTEAGTRAVFVSSYTDAAALQQVLDMGAVEGASQAINQIDDLLAA